MLDPKYIPLFLGGFIVWMAFVVGVGFFGSRGKREGEKFLTGGSDMSLFLICGMSATMSSGGSDAISGVTILLTDVMPSVTGRRIPVSLAMPCSAANDEERLAAVFAARTGK